ncbi:MAG: 5-methylcytosine-specific restriction endonuclease McrA [Marivirga sp.]|jgi:5-methylcytosine-specific restriction endonuclease McrA
MEIRHIRTLVLNADYSPITVCGFQKAFLLVFLNKADILVKDDQPLRTVDRVFTLPSVIKLKQYAKIPYKGVELTRINVFKRDSFMCQYCGTQKDLTLDHLIPRAKGGKSVWNNLVTACKRCNARKGQATPEASGLSLVRKPYKPSYVIFIRDFSGEISSCWLPYLRVKEEIGKKLTDSSLIKSVSVS